MLIVLLWTSAAWITFGALAAISIVGKPREPLAPGVAVVGVVASAVIVGAVISAAIALS